MNEENKAMVSGTIKTQKGHFVRVESTKNLNFVVCESQKHKVLRLPLVG
jgi:hypothetical protein